MDLRPTKMDENAQLSPPSSPRKRGSSLRPSFSDWIPAFAGMTVERWWPIKSSVDRRIFGAGGGTPALPAGKRVASAHLDPARPVFGFSALLAQASEGQVRSLLGARREEEDAAQQDLSGGNS
jgi:hypothetical protein